MCISLDYHKPKSSSEPISRTDTVKRMYYLLLGINGKLWYTWILLECWVRYGGYGMVGMWWRVCGGGYGMVSTGWWVWDGEYEMVGIEW